jgi:hypothetical protein
MHFIDKNYSNDYKYTKVTLTYLFINKHIKKSR